MKKNKILKKSTINTPLGEMVAVADQDFLYLLEFITSPKAERKMERLCSKLNATIEQGVTAPIESIKNELLLYFSGKLQRFKTPIKLIGTAFQCQAWECLQNIPYAETRSYKEQAKNIKAPLSHRAIANANGANKLAIIIPCHRVIQHNGKMGGYAGGIKRKEWLITHEQKNL